MNFITNMFPERIEMKMKNAWGVIVLTVILWVFISISGFAKTGNEPNLARYSPHAPDMDDGTRILEPLEYKLTVNQDPAQNRSGPPNNSPAGSSENPTAVGPASHGGYTKKRLHGNNFGFSFELPDYWLWDLLPDNCGYLLSGPGGTEENEVIIVVQAVEKAAKPGSSAAKQMQEAKVQIQGISGAEIRS
jgi:hypothetical protein